MLDAICIQITKGSTQVGESIGKMFLKKRTMITKPFDKELMDDSLSKVNVVIGEGGY